MLSHISGISSPMEGETNHGEYEQYVSMGTRAKAERIALGTHVQFGCSRHRDDISTGGSLEGETRSEDR